MVTLKQKIKFLVVPMSIIASLIFSIACAYVVWYYALCYAIGITSLFSIIIINIPDHDSTQNDDNYMEMP